MTLVIGSYYTLGGFFSVEKNKVSANVRTVQLSNNEMDYQAILNEFEDSTLTTEGTLTTFTGYQALDPSVFEEIDNLSESDVETLAERKVGYKFTYDTESNVVTIYASMENELDEIEMDELSGLAFMNNNNEIDAIFVIDEDTILLSELRDAGMIANTGWLSRLFKKVVISVVVQVVGLGATATIGVATAQALGILYDTNEIVTAYSNYQHNKELIPYSTDLINGQAYYSEWRFGNKTFDQNGCGVIATYNVMYLLGKNPSLADVAYEIERRHGTLAWGYLGTDPMHPYEYFLSQGIAIKKYSNIEEYGIEFTNMKSSQYAIICYFNNKDDISQGAHFVTIEKIRNNKYKVFNLYNNTTTAVFRNSLEEIIGNGKLITGFIIN